MNSKELKILIKNNQPIYFEDNIVRVVEFFDIFNIAEIIFENQKKIIVDISLLSDKKLKNKESSINIFTGGNINDKSFGK
ncbi:hypothetical protein [Clostridium perfringens]|uniref:hypothetical protein n=1 Tax=Clostridium perfringens TaxID=1502 RepID=UPI0018E464E7|nr:hypothetical protein [Clostridium perfringens]MBI5997482.1 hypothetical protein [Clostridium perfringens]